MVPFIQNINKEISDELMNEVYCKIKTPIKYGPVMQLEMDFTDSPSVFRWEDKYYMYFIAISKDCSISGYETHLAVSDDMKQWEDLGVVLGRNEDARWDSKQIAGYAAFTPIAFDGEHIPEKINGKYYISYLGGGQNGYEPDPLCAGLVLSENPIDPKTWQRTKEPILSPYDKDRRPGEEKTIYKSFLFEDPSCVTGYSYVNVYNAKGDDNRERIYLAVSNDATHWERYGDGPVLDQVTEDPDSWICGDPQIVQIDSVYVMLYYRYQKGKGAYNTFACSYDLIHWKTWNGKPLVEPEFEWEDVHAHKTWFLREKGVNYHFYCAVNHKNERFIALAVSDI